MMCPKMPAHAVLRASLREAAGLIGRGFGRHYVSAAPWCSGLTCHPVTVEIEGSNPFGVAILPRLQFARSPLKLVGGGLMLDADALYGPSRCAYGASHVSL